MCKYVCVREGGYTQSQDPKNLFPRLFYHLSYFKRFYMSEIGLYLTTIIHNVFIAFLSGNYNNGIYTADTAFNKYRNIG